MQINNKKITERQEKRRFDFDRLNETDIRFNFQQTTEIGLVKILSDLKKIIIFNIRRKTDGDKYKGWCNISLTSHPSKSENITHLTNLKKRVEKPICFKKSGGKLRNTTIEIHNRETTTRTYLWCL